jgi:hypothetical protein
LFTRVIRQWVREQPAVSLLEGVRKCVSRPGRPVRGAWSTDFGAINIDAELIAGACNGVVSLANGRICCSAEGDLLHTPAGILRRSPRPDYILI